MASKMMLLVVACIGCLALMELERHASLFRSYLESGNGERGNSISHTAPSIVGYADVTSMADPNRSRSHTSFTKKFKHTENNTILYLHNAANNSVNNKNNNDNNNNNNNETFLLFVLVASSPANAGRRTAIRKTWKRQLKKINNKNNNNNNNKNNHDQNSFFKFIIGTSGLNAEERRRIAIEEERHNDIIVASFHDTYYNLTLKTLVGVQWMVARMEETQAGYKFLLKCDDDTFVNLVALRKLLTTYRTFKNFALGKLIKRKRLRDVVVERGEVLKWWNWIKNWKKQNILGVYNESYNDKSKFNSDGLFEKDVKQSDDTFSLMSEYMRNVCESDGLVDYRFLPNYLSGSAYVISEHAAIQLNTLSPHYPLFLFEDVHVTGILTQKTMTKLIGSELFRIYKEEGFDVCSNQVTCHYVTELGMYQFWNDYMTSKCF